MLSRLFGFDSNWNSATDEIWFGRTIQQGLVESWLIVVKFLKFRLRLEANGEYKFKCEYDSGWTKFKENQRKRIEAGGYDGLVLLRPGYTRLDKKAIEQRFQAVRAQFPMRLTFTQCQQFLQQFVAQIIDRPDIYYQWFVDNTDINRQWVPQLPGPPPALVAAAHERVQQAQQAERDRINRFQMMANGVNYNAGY